MKIIIIAINMTGGVGRVISEIKKEFVKRKHKVKIFLRDDYESESELKKEVEKESYDVLYTQDWSCCKIFLFSKNHFSCFHGNNPGKLGYVLQTLIGKFIGKNLVVVGPSLKKRFPKSTMIYNGVDKEEFCDMKLERKYFGWIDKKTEMYDEATIKKEAEKYNLSLLIAKDIPSNEMNKFYNKCKVFASYPPYSGGFNLCWIEAKASGVPIILGNENGIGITKALNEKFSWEFHVNKLLEIFNEPQTI